MVDKQGILWYDLDKNGILRYFVDTPEERISGEILTPREVSELLKIHPRTVKRLAGKGKIPGFLVGKQWRFNKTEVEDWSRSAHNENNKEKPNE